MRCAIGEMRLLKDDTTSIAAPGGLEHRVSVYHASKRPQPLPVQQLRYCCDIVFLREAVSANSLNRQPKGFLKQGMQQPLNNALGDSGSRYTHCVGISNSR